MAQALPDGTPLLAKAGSGSDSGDDDEMTASSATFGVGDRYATDTIVRLRNAPGTVNKPADDVLAALAAGTRGVVNDGPVDRDSMSWWQVRTVDVNGQTLVGWMAEALPDGTILMRPIDDGTEEGLNQTFVPGDQYRTQTIVNMRRSPGTVDKSQIDIVAEIPTDTVGTVIGGPADRDGMVWWQVRTPDGQRKHPGRLDGRIRARWNRAHGSAGRRTIRWVLSICAG